VTKKIWLSLLVVIVFVIFASWVAYACGNQSSCKGKDNCPVAMKDAKVEVTNMDNGIMIQITSNDPEVVKQIQERTANCKCGGGKDANCEVTKIATGATLRITSDDPEVVKLIQERQANCMKNCQKEGSEECLKAHESGKCSGHAPGGKH
jgi:TusA-related sulfurtransferase